MKKNLNIVPSLRIHALNTCLMVKSPHPYYFPGEFHPFWEMIYVTDGSLFSASGDKIYRMRKGDVIFHKPMEFHRLWSTEGSDVHALVIGFSAKGEGLNFLAEGAFVLSEKQQANIDGILEYLNRNFSEEKNFLDHMEKNYCSLSGEIQTFINRYEIFLLSLIQKHDPLTEKALVEDEVSILYRKTVAELNRNVEGWITTEELAKKLCCSSSQLKRTFAKYSNIGIHKYHLKLKMAAAGRMLRQGITPSRIAGKLGFASQNYFSTVFKRETGVSPSMYLRHDPDEK